MSGVWANAELELEKVELGERAARYWDAAAWYVPSGLLIPSHISEKQALLTLHLMLAIEAAEFSLT